MNLSNFENPGFQRGKPWIVEALWRVMEGLFFNSWIPGSGWRVHLLRLFGCRLGTGVVIKPHVKIKFPWKLSVGDHSWIGEEVWIDNLDEVVIGNHCCVSQGAYLCTGNHRWDLDAFNLVTQPIQLEDFCWVCAKTKIGPGVVCHQGSVLLMGSVATDDLEEWNIHSGAPAKSVGLRSRAQK